MIRLGLLFLGVLALPPCLGERLPVNSETAAGEPMPAAEAAATMEVPEGFDVSVFASEPEIRNPIDCSWDVRGRLWVAENLTYERLGRKLAEDEQDQVLVFSDQDGDGVHDERKVFVDGLTQLTSIEWTPEGLWLMCPPQLLFVPDRNRDDVPDGPPEVVLDGFLVPGGSHHNFANGLRVGPDGWLYGRCGASAPGEVGVPGSVASERVPIRGGMWRFDRHRRMFEVLNHGTTNPWGHDWNEEGELFFINTVNGHFFHSIDGAHYKRGVSVDPNPLVYQLIGMHADHWHFDRRGNWTKSRDGAANEFGGGHAHVGFMIYQGGSWPEVYNGRAFTLNLHGRRCNQERLEREGSGYVARHEDDFFVSRDPFFRGIELSGGPDGNVFVLDWSDTGECHESTGVHRTSGRIFKLSHGGRISEAPESLESLSIPELVALHDDPNVWMVRMARMELLSRGDRKEAEPMLLKKLSSEALPGTRLRVLHTLSQLGEVFDGGPFLSDQSVPVRAWAVDHLMSRFPLDTIDGHPRVGKLGFPRELAGSLAAMALKEPSPLVRLKLASALQRIPVAFRSEVAIGLVAHAEDASDHNLAPLIWSGLMVVAVEKPDELIEVAKASRIPRLRRWIARYLIENDQRCAGELSDLLRNSDGRDDDYALDLLTGFEEGTKGRQRMTCPDGWEVFAESLGGAEVSERRQSLEVLFGDGRALEEILRVAKDRGAALSSRLAALETLIQARPDDLAAVCLGLLGDKALARLAAQGLMASGDERAGPAIVAKYRRFSRDDRPAVIAALVSRESGATVVLKALRDGKIPKSDVGAYHARLIRGFGDEELNAELEDVWGSVGQGREVQLEFIEKLKAAHVGDGSEADLAHGRMLFERNCASCHMLYGNGKEIGPDLTGSGRFDLDYLLENIVTPAAALSKDYYLTSITTDDGQVVAGVLKSENEKVLAIQTMNSLESLEKDRIADRRQDPVSLMPEGLLESMSSEERRDLLAYLMSPNQVALPVEGASRGGK